MGEEDTINIGYQNMIGSAYIVHSRKVLPVDDGVSEVKVGVRHVGRGTSRQKHVEVRS